MEARHREPQDPPPPRAADLVHRRQGAGVREPLGGGPRRDERTDHARPGAAAVRLGGRRPGQRRPCGTCLPARDDGGRSRRDLRGPGSAGSVRAGPAGDRLLGRLRQPPEGRGHECGRAGRGAHRPGLGRSRRSARRDAGRGRGARVTPAETTTPSTVTLGPAVEMTTDARRAALDAVAAEVRTCTRCRLAQTRTNAVPGEGRPDTEVVFVGEGPGQTEDQQGRPFVGRAGDLLVKLLSTLGWRRQEVFITNIVKCRPPGNRDPEPDEIAACLPYLQRQLEVLDPAVVVTLGRFSMGHFRPGERITQIHGTDVAAPATTGARDALAFAMFHPAAALRSTDVERQSYDDMAMLPRVLKEARAQRVEARAASVPPASADAVADPATSFLGASQDAPTLF